MRRLSVDNPHASGSGNARYQRSLITQAGLSSVTDNDAITNQKAQAVAALLLHATHGIEPPLTEIIKVRK